MHPLSFRLLGDLHPDAFASHVTALTINRLADREVDAMIDRVVGNKLLPASVRQDIIEELIASMGH